MTISVTFRLNKKPDSKIAGHADVILEFPDGKIQVNSFCVFKPNGRPTPGVVPPATKGDQRYFPLVKLSGELRKRIEAAILAEYEKQKKTSGDEF